MVEKVCLPSAVVGDAFSEHLSDKIPVWRTGALDVNDGEQ